MGTGEEERCGVLVRSEWYGESASARAPGGRGWWRVVCVWRALLTVVTGCYVSLLVVRIACMAQEECNEWVQKIEANKRLFEQQNS